jgi:endogenous inhibitor of DNA gyrase (YacG/DUF329 family)
MKKCALCGKKRGWITYSKDGKEFCSQSCVQEYEDRQAGRSSYCAICGKKATGWLRFVEDGFTFCGHDCLTKYRDRKRK